MKPVFLDTSGLIGVLNTRDQWHERANVIWSELIRSKTPSLTTSLILIELADAMSRHALRKRAIEVRDRLIQAKQIDVVRITARDEDRGWDLCRSRDDKQWGMTDCISMIVIEERGIESVLTADRHFEQAGYAALLK